MRNRQREGNHQWHEIIEILQSLMVPTKRRPCLCDRLHSTAPPLALFDSTGFATSATVYGILMEYLVHPVVAITFIHFQIQVILSKRSRLKTAYVLKHYTY